MTIIAEIASVYVLITSIKEVPLNMAVFFSMIAFDTALVIHLVIKFMSLPYTESKKALLNIGLKTSKNPSSKWFVRYVKSCARIKLFMFDGNFYDKATSIIVWQFCVETLVSLLLI